MLKHLGLLLDTLHLYYARFKKKSHMTCNCRVQIKEHTKEFYDVYQVVVYYI
jgi:hypothetical protein